MQRMINMAPGRSLNLMLALLPFALLLLLYIVASDARLAENANDKLLPSFSQMGDAVQRMAFEPSKRTGEYLLWVDTASSLTRLGLGVLIAAVLGLLIGMLSNSANGSSASIRFSVRPGAMLIMRCIVSPCGGEPPRSL